ncbi:unnamed protein product, partial [Cyprideis torosa]
MSLSHLEDNTSLDSKRTTRPTCDHPFQETPGGKCIFSPKEILQGSWDEAQQICGFLKKDSRLLEFRTADELLDVTSYLSQNDADCSRWPSGMRMNIDKYNVIKSVSATSLGILTKFYFSGGGPWIGAIEVGNTNQFIWSSDNSTVVVENWVQGQPNSPSSGDGAMMSCEFTFEWMDKSRDTVLPVLCEVEPRAKCPAQFTAVGDTCYYLGNSSIDWNAAQDYCGILAPNGKLVELETLEEIYLLTEFLNKNSPDR